jgi:ribosomal protein S18 acetylase RimI-like enzyme
MRRDLGKPIAPAELPAGLRLIPFDIDTARACRELMNRVYAEGFGDVVDFESWWPWLTGDSDYDPRLMFVAARDGEVVGFCHCWTGAFIKDVVVDPSARGIGLGAALVTMVLLACKAQGAPSVDLKTDVENVKAQSLYRRLGFEIVERVER